MKEEIYKGYIINDAPGWMFKGINKASVKYHTLIACTVKQLMSMIDWENRPRYQRKMKPSIKVF